MAQCTLIAQGLEYGKLRPASQSDHDADTAKLTLSPLTYTLVKKRSAKFLDFALHY